MSNECTLQHATKDNENSQGLSYVNIYCWLQNRAVFWYYHMYKQLFTEQSLEGTNKHLIWMWLLPSGKITLIFRTDIRLFMSLWMLSATPGYCNKCESKKWNQSRQIKKEVVREAEKKLRVRIPGSSWRFLCRLLAPRDAPGRWMLQQMVCLQRTTASLSSRAPAPPLELSISSEPNRKYVSNLQNLLTSICTEDLANSCKQNWSNYLLCNLIRNCITFPLRFLTL